MKLSEVKAGDVIVADGGFTCIRDKAVLTVKKDIGGLFVLCDQGTHMLDGQLDESGNLVGFSIPQTRGVE